MSRAKPERRGAVKARSPRGAMETRIDGAHRLASKDTEAATGRPEVAEPAMAVAPSLIAASSPTEQLRLQANQLAEHLRTRQRELDQRESRLNAQLAQIDLAGRQTRLWITEQQGELAEQQAALEERKLELGKRETELEAAYAAAQQQAVMSEELARHEQALNEKKKELAEAEQQVQRAIADQEEFLRERAEQMSSAVEEKLRHAEEELAQKEELLHDRERQIKALAEKLQAQAAAQNQVRSTMSEERERSLEVLQQEKQKIDAHRQASEEMIRQMMAGVERRRAALDAEAARIREHASRPSPELLAREQQVEETRRRLEARERQLHEQEIQLAATREEIERVQQELAEERRKAEEQMRGERQRLQAEQRRMMAELEEKRLSLQRRSEYIDQCRGGLEQLRAELGEMHRETLEIRLATEELWIQMSSTTPTPVLTRSLTQLRAKLSEHYRTAGEELARQRNDLLTIRNGLAQQHERLVQQKHELELWATKRREEIELQAARLVAREQELDRQEAEFKEQARKWQVEQLAYRAEIQRLQVRSESAATV